MKKLLSAYILFLGVVFSAHAQQIPLYSQYYYNPFLYNPAMAGYHNYGNIYLDNRSQWTGIPGAPVTRALTIEGPVKINKVGLGLSIADDQTDIFERINVEGAYSYNIHMGQDNDLRLGLSAGYEDNRIDFNKVRVKDPKDNTILTQFEDRSTFDATFGISYHYKNLLLGVSIPQLLAPKLQYMENSSAIIYYSLVRHYILSAQYNIPLSARWSMTPMAYAQYADGAPFLLDAGLNLKYRDIAWLGLVWRKDFAISASAGIKLHDRLSLGYSYDIMTNAISPYAGATHEIVVGYAFGKAAGKADELGEKLKEMNERMDRAQRKNSVTRDSLSREINKLQDQIKEDHRSFEDFQKEMTDSISKLSKREQTSTAVNNPNTTFYMLDRINFGKTDAKLTYASYHQLDELATALKNNPKMKIEIDGYCDNAGNAEFNDKLSQERADAVKNYLVSKGVNESKIKTNGLGGSNPIGDNATEEGRQKNRRVEFKVLEQ